MDPTDLYDLSTTLGAFMSDEGQTHPIVVLLVEDEPVIRMSAVTILSSEGFEVLEAMDAQAAIAILAVDADRIHVLFTDARLPGSMDGFMLARYVRMHWPWISLIINSGVAGAADHEMPEGSRFFTKPYDLRDIAIHIRQTATAAPDI
jgi:CheY-like chemotaxis protein